MDFELSRPALPKSVAGEFDFEIDPESVEARSLWLKAIRITSGSFPGCADRINLFPPRPIIMSLIVNEMKAKSNLRQAINLSMMKSNECSRIESAAARSLMILPCTMTLRSFGNCCSGFLCQQSRAFRKRYCCSLCSLTAYESTSIMF